MKMKDVKILWGHAGNRCAFPDCRIKLTPDGKIDTLGEMAHIVAKSPQGPRGNSDMPIDKRDDYSNLILLCPTHHKMIDTFPEEWTIEKLLQLRQEHEQWVSSQLEQGRIEVRSIDNSDFLNSRKRDWLKFVKSNVWAALSLTPLSISDDVIDPLDRTLLNIINQIKVPEDTLISINPVVNHYHTRPNEYGVINEDLRKYSNGMGHRIQVFRNGYCEFLICLEGSTRQITKFVHKKYPNEPRGIRILRYAHIAKYFDCQISALKQIWDEVLPFNDMSITALITNTNSTQLSYKKERNFGRGPVFGPPVSSQFLEYTQIINRKMSQHSISELIIKRFANFFGLTLKTIFDEQGHLLEPKRLSWQ